MNKGWEIKKLGEVLKLEYGKPLPDTKRKDNGKYPVYGANGLKGRSNEFYYDKKTIIVGRKGSAGEINLTEEKFWPLDVSYFVTFDEKKYNLLFLFHLSSLLDLPKLAKGVKPGINRNEVYNLEVSLPPLPEQHRIVSIIDECFSAIERNRENAERNLRNAKEVFESYLQGVFATAGSATAGNFKDTNNCNDRLEQSHEFLKSFETGKNELITKQGWVVKKLGEVCELSAGGDVPKNDFSEIKTEKHPIPIYANGKKNNGLYGFTNIAKITKPSVTVSARGTIGFSVIRNESFYPIVRLIVVTPKHLQNLDLSYLYYSLKAIDFKHTGTSIPQLTVPMIKDYSIPFPPLTDQQLIVRRLDALRDEVQKLEAVYQKKIDNFAELKKSVLGRAFAGELT
jgi:type I restriction enzyme S subunit